MTKHQKAIADGMLTPEEVAAEASVKPDTVLDWCKTRRLPAYRFNERVIRIKPSDWEAFKESKRI
jgi:excisionase family DNA binding protein